MVECTLRDTEMEGLDGGNLLRVDVPAAQVDAINPDGTSVVTGTITGGPGRKNWKDVRKYKSLRICETLYPVEGIDVLCNEKVRIALGRANHTSCAKYEGDA